jgi:hypothetical protein
MYPPGEPPRPNVADDAACSLGCSISDVSSNELEVNMFASKGGAIDDSLYSGTGVSNSASDGSI